MWSYCCYNIDITTELLSFMYSNENRYIRERITVCMYIQRKPRIILDVLTRGDPAFCPCVEREGYFVDWIVVFRVFFIGGFTVYRLFLQ